MERPREESAAGEDPHQDLNPTTQEVDWGSSDLEQAYLRALEALEAIEQPPIAAESPAEPTDTGALTSEGVTIPPAAGEIPAGPLAASISAAEEAGVAPPEILEAVLFVGGGALPGKRLAALLGSQSGVELVERTVDELNQRYQEQGRPYEIRFGEGGYRFALRQEFEVVRNRVYGVGPREVRLSQDVLEILALVAYQQPISQLEVEQRGKRNSGGILRQLLRRELISMQRTGTGRNEVEYRTTPRFLSVFGLEDLEYLPRSDDLEFK